MTEPGDRGAPGIGVAGPEPYDPGLAGDRTALAWTRSALSVAANGVLIAHAGLVAGVPAVGLVAGVAMAGAALWVWRTGQAPYVRRRHPDVRPSAHHQARALRILSLVTVTSAVTAVALSLVLTLGRASS